MFYVDCCNVDMCSSMVNLRNYVNRITGLAVVIACCAGLPATRSAKADTAEIVVDDLTRNGTQPLTQVLEATTAVRELYAQEQRSQIHPKNYSLSRYPFTAAHQTHWQTLLWSTGVVEPRAPYIDQSVAYLIAQAGSRHLLPAQRHTVEMALQVGTQLYLSDPAAQPTIKQAFLDTLDQAHSTKWVAMAFSALAQTDTPQQRQRLSDRIRQRFPNWHQDLYLKTTLHDIAALDRPPATPSVDELLAWTIAPEQLHMYVLCSADRGELCQAVLKDRSGQFVREADGQLWSVPLGLRSLHSGLSWNFTRGETPQGIYRIEGTIPQPDTDYFRPYGQFALVQLFVPHEPGTKAFLPGRTDLKVDAPWSGGLAAYQTLLPPSWRNIYPFSKPTGRERRGVTIFASMARAKPQTFLATVAATPPAKAGIPPLAVCPLLKSTMTPADYNGRICPKF